MQKQIFSTCILLMTSLTAMEKSSKIQLQLTHQSPEITCVHTQKYLKHLEKKVNISTIGNNSDLTQHKLKEDLDNVTHTLNAINNLIELKKESETQPHYTTVLLPTSYNYFCASNKPQKIYYHSTYALMPIATAYALKKSFKRILIIDEALDQSPDYIKKNYPNIKDPLKYIQKQKQSYYAHGNGALLYPDKNDNPELFNLFNDKVITYDQIYPRTLLNFFNNDGKDTDLVLYYMNRWEDYDYFNHEWKPKIFSLFQKLIPTIFIIPEARYSYPTRGIPNHISSIAKTIGNLFLPKKKLESPAHSSDSSSSQNDDDYPELLSISSFITNLFLPVKKHKPLSPQNNDDDLNTSHTSVSKKSLSHSSHSSSSQNNDNDSKSLSISISSESESIGDEATTGIAAALLKLLDNVSNETSNSETSSYDDSYDLDPFVFKITTDTEEMKTYDGANYTLLAENITVTDDGIMEVTLSPYYKECNSYERFTNSTLISSDESNNSSPDDSTESGEASSLSHESPEITCVHTQEYLYWLTRNYDTKKLKSDLNLVTTVLNATNDVINAKKNEALKPHYSICVIPDNYYGAGNSKHNCADSYAIIPIAVAHALQSNLFKRILIIDLLEPATHQSWESDKCHEEITEYYKYGNGSVLYPNQIENPGLFDLFDGKIINSDKIQGNLYHFLETAGKDVDLIFYNIDMEIGGLPEIPRCWIFLKNRIPTIFILSGHPGKEKYDPIPAENMSKTIATNTGHEPINIHYWYKTEK